MPSKSNGFGQVSVEQMTCARIPTEFGQFELCLYANNRDNEDHLALVMGEVHDQSDVLVRIHSECLTGDVLGSIRCDCGSQLAESMEAISSVGQGVLIYLRQEGRGIGLADKLRAYNLQDEGYDTVEANLLLGHQADERDYSIAAAILEDLEIRSVRLLTNNPAKVTSLLELGIHVSDRLPLQAEVTVENANYLRAKAIRLNHFLDAGRDGHAA